MTKGSLGEKQQVTQHSIEEQIDERILSQVSTGGANFQGFKLPTAVGVGLGSLMCGASGAALGAATGEKNGAVKGLAIGAPVGAATGLLASVVAAKGLI